MKLLDGDLMAKLDQVVQPEKWNLGATLKNKEHQRLFLFARLELYPPPFRLRTLEPYESLELSLEIIDGVGCFALVRRQAG